MGLVVRVSFSATCTALSNKYGQQCYLSSLSSTAIRSYHFDHNFDFAVWAQEEEDLLQLYRPTQLWDGQWRKYIPDPHHPGYFAAAVSHDFTIKTAHGTKHGSKGDFIIKVRERKQKEVPLVLPLALFVRITAVLRTFKTKKRWFYIAN